MGIGKGGREWEWEWEWGGSTVVAVVVGGGGGGSIAVKKISRAVLEGVFRKLRLFLQGKEYNKQVVEWVTAR